MMMLAPPESLRDLSDDHIDLAIESREATRALLDHLAVVARPGDEVRRLLVFFARLAASGCEWLDGDLRVELLGDGQVTVIELLTDLGGGMRERAMLPVALSLPIDEVREVVERAPFLIAPLTLKTGSERRLVFAFVTDSEAPRGTAPPPAVRIADANLVDHRSVAALRAAPVPRIEPPLLDELDDDPFDLTLPAEFPQEEAHATGRYMEEPDMDSPDDPLFGIPEDLSKVLPESVAAPAEGPSTTRKAPGPDLPPSQIPPESALPSTTRGAQPHSGSPTTVRADELAIPSEATGDDMPPTPRVSLDPEDDALEELWRDSKRR